MLHFLIFSCEVCFKIVNWLFRCNSFETRGAELGARNLQIQILEREKYTSRKAAKKIILPRNTQKFWIILSIFQQYVLIISRYFVFFCGFEFVLFCVLCDLASLREIMTKIIKKGVDFLIFLDHYPITVVELFLLMVVTDSSTGAAPGIKQGGFWRDDSLPVERRWSY